MGFSSDADTPLWEFWCGSVSGFCYQKGSPLDIESIFRAGERCLHTNAPWLTCCHNCTMPTHFCSDTCIAAQHRHPPTVQSRQIPPRVKLSEPPTPSLILHLFAALKIVLDKIRHLCHNTTVLSLFSRL